MRTVNAIELLELVRQHAPVSRARLAELSNLSKPTVSDRIDSLIAEGLIVELGTGKAGARGGKRPTLVQLNAEYGRILSVDVGPEWIRFASSDLLGQKAFTCERLTNPERGARAVLNTIKRGLSDLLRRDSASNTRLRVISVAVPGIVDVRNGVVLETDNIFGWTNLQLGSELKKVFDCQVYVDNDVNMAALAEIRTHVGTPVRNFVLIRASTGIGAAIVFGNDVYHGTHWSAGEIAHLVLDLKAHALAADRRGYLESIVGTDRIAHRLGRSASDVSVFKEWPDSRDPKALKVKEEVVTHLGTAIANISAVLDPDVFVLLGDVFPILITRIQEVATKLVPWPIQMRLSRLGDDAALEGTIVAGLSRAYETISWILQSGGKGPHEVHASFGR